MSWTPRLAVLPEPQRRLWPRLGGHGDRFVLYGGTALALRLGHRASVDFDLFSDSEFHPSQLAEQTPLLAGARIDQVERNTLVVTVDAVQVSFFGGLPFPMIDVPDQADNGLLVASLLDLSATKAKALVDRTEVKDYQDLDAILAAGIPLADVLGAFEVLFPSVSPMIIVRSLGYLDDPRLATLARTARQRLDSAASRVRSASRIVPQYPSISAAIRAARGGASS